MSLSILCSLLAVSLFTSGVNAATAEQWRSRSIYQIITDRFALPAGANLNNCDVDAQTWCGGTWNTIRDNLDFVQNMGFTAIWISPVQQNYQGSRTPYGDPYHGYWIQDLTQLNDKFGTSDDLKALVAELHKRDMYIMVDVVVNNVMALNTQPDYSRYMFKDASLYHPYCPIQWGNTTSEQDCWLGDLNVTLPDLDTTNPTVVNTYQSWVKDFVQEYQIDGLRIDAAKHVNKEFWPGFCESAGVFCIGEVFGGLDVEDAAQWQGPLDSVLNFPLYSSLLQGFTIPGPANITAVTDTLTQSKKLFKDTTVLGNFLENQDVPRFASQSVDPQSMNNAMTFTFMYDGIPIVYYGQEFSFNGAGDPKNREPLWPSGYASTPASDIMTKLNQLRNFLVNTTEWATSEPQVLSSSQYGLSFVKGDVISIITNIGSPPQNGTNIAVPSPYDANTGFTELFSCKQWVAGSKGYLDAEYTLGGKPIVLVLSTLMDKSPLCKGELVTSQGLGADSSNAVQLRWSFRWPGLAAIMSLLLAFPVVW
ncbi:glycoside hydrolase family 13 protein [Dendrothele bispora CBS 962.96]|uniref:alpha-amylase n=1 Tax=Dendrothele bispora (strain CBS 962.96) TaxID=1314807 RepID=A0A4S8MXD2_DENBC|nr:glycoside hydrolase family 13 protein [Dendrothele bispora CBS 962.96]